ncbi:hypothetical protein A1O1_04844 [Capronia coronata CBS 617.96]|uniref:Uncharacterized protein n=1 Tax=Capronia coronata CBS 617.96 TaxID=1182541 RepID=W9Y543_9EURO|nr:uncharacterized protein A1O1_04844 [Capronia coronata CBS 617.96]EXJ87917.1 hypothetical protein A1O1_04844 [Capronia coronata CBS 617.96]
MVFNPTSPIRAFGHKPVIVSRTAAPPSEVAPAEKNSTMSPAEIPRSPSPLTGWRGGVSRLMRQSQERNPAQEVSRWSKTTTESEASEALQAPPPKKTNVLKKKTKQNRNSKDTTHSSPVDPSYDPITKTLRPIGDAGMPTLAVTGPDEPRSFYDSGSDDSSDAEHVIHRASSVRVARPHIVQHSNASGGSVPKLYSPQSAKPKEEQAVAEASAPRISELKKLQDMAASAERRQKRSVSGSPADALKALEGHHSDTGTTAASTQASTTAGPSEQNNTMKGTILEFPDTPGKLEALDTLPTPMGGFGSLRMPSTSTSSKTDTTHSSRTYVSPGSIDGLRSNPVTETDKSLSRAISAPVRNPARRVMIRPSDLIINRTNNDPKLFRESIVSTPYPSRYSSTGDIDAEKATNTQDTRTPRSLRRARPLSHHKEKDEEKEKDPDAQEKDEKSHNQPPEVPMSTKPLHSAPVTSRSDRFPSPVAPEVLFLDLRLARHPAARVRVEIEVSDKTTFDDEALFTLIREAYNGRLLGVVRRFFSTRTLSYASVANSSAVVIPTITNSHNTASGLRGLGLGYWHGLPPPAPALEGGIAEIDGGDFVKHLLRPRHGRRRKMWLLWLRNNQDSSDSPAARRSGVVSSSSTYSPQAPESPVFSFVHSRQGSSSGAGTGVAGAGVGVGVVGVGNGNGNGITHNHDHDHDHDLPSSFSTSSPNNPAMPTTNLSTKPSISIPRMPFQQPFPIDTYRSKSLLATTRSRSRHYHHLQYKQHHLHSGPPTLYLHHTFSLRKIVAMLCLSFLLAMFTTTMWILFGVPGRGADQGNGTTEVQGKEYPLSWRRDAQGRVGVGLVLGIVVLGIELVGELVWVWASWILV